MPYRMTIETSSTREIFKVDHPDAYEGTEHGVEIVISTNPNALILFPWHNVKSIVVEEVE